MNVEIGFRAWDEKNKIMYNDFQFIRSGIEGNDWIVFVSDKLKRKIIDSGILLNNPFFSQQLKTMQFIGLTDKNEKKIFEGDVVEDGSIVNNYGKPFRGLIEFERSAFRFVKTNCECGECLGSVVIHGNELIVIGNIYENENLLEAK